MKKNSRVWIFIISLACLSAWGKSDPGFSFPSTPAGRRAAAYFSAFNSGAEQEMKVFLQTHFAAAALNRAPIEERLARYRSFKAEAGSLQPEKLLGAQANQIVLLTRTGKGELLEITFEHEAQAPFKLLSIRIEQTEPAGAEELSGPPLNEAEVLARLEDELAKRSQADLFSGVVLLARNGVPLFHKAYGLASLEYGVANRPDTRFNLGSINKEFTRIAIEQLAEKGLLSLEDRLGKFLPDYPNPEAARQVTVGQLLEMMSGIGDFFGKKYAATPKERIRTLADYLPLFASEPLRFEPGSSREYSNGGYVVLGLIIEKVSGQSYYDYVREHVYQPAGMGASAHLDADIPTAHVASGYTRNWDENEHPGEARRNNMYTRPARGSSAGGGYSIAEDLLKFSLALRQGRLLGPAANARVSGPMAIAGGAPGINAVLETDPVPGYTIVVLSNYDPPAAIEVAKMIRHLLRRLKK